VPSSSFHFSLLSPTIQTEDMMSRCLLVSNRLPISYDETQKKFKPSAGGLVSAIKGLDQTRVGREFLWMGILTDDVQKELIEEARATPAGNIMSHPIVVSKQTYHYYYNEYCNNVIWPLFHYEHSMVSHSEKGWRSYIEVNQKVADAILAEFKEGDSVWVHDFQLMLVPGMLKKVNPKIKIGFFLHIPFPSSEIFRELPQREEILRSLMASDLIGFHDLSYLNHFRSSLHRILGENPLNERMLGVYPISIDSQHFVELSEHKQTLEFIEKYKENKKDKKWILGVDRLDYIKGLVLKLRAFKRFLRENPEERGKVQLVQIVIPSRTEVPEYQRLKNRIEQLVSNINGEFGNPAYMPVVYIFHSVSDYELSALYQLSEVLNVSSRRDGMNLVSLEYIVSQTDKYPGVVLLSEFAGAHSTLSYAMSINPWNIEETAHKIKEAIHHPEVQRRAEIGAMKEFLLNYNSSEWARVFLRDLHRESSKRTKAITISHQGSFPWMESLKGKHVVLFCDLDGTLAPISPRPSEVRLQDETVKLLKEIAHTDCQFVVVSGRDKEFLERQFVEHDFDFPLASCHGAYTYSPEDKKWHSLVEMDQLKWKKNVMDILKLYTSRTPGSFIEDKGHAVTWHYRNSPQDFAGFLANKLFFELEEILTSQPVHVHRGKKVIEVKSMNANKGFFVQQWLQQQDNKPDVVVAIGDDTTDEDMFEAIQGHRDFKPYCIKVGREDSHAPYFITDQRDVNLFLKNFLSIMDDRHEAPPS
jgi:trehalose 6-phosphate synthase/phosphatase